MPDFAQMLAALLAGMVYVLVPRPATMAVLSLSAVKGRGAALAFLIAHLAGDLFRTVMALLSLAGISRLGPGLFDLPGLVCGLWLCWLGVQALRAMRAHALPVPGSPWRSGLIFGLSNPRAWPFALAMLTALLGAGVREIGPAAAGSLLAACFAGFVIAGLIVVFWTGTVPVRRFYSRHARGMTRFLGLVFIAFGLKTLQDTISSARGRV